MGRIKRSKIIAFALLALLCACGQHDGFSPADSTAYPEVWEALHSFNWMGNDDFAGKPFLAANDDSLSAMAGIIDLNGDILFFLGTYHVPRGIPAIELFAFADGGLTSVGGFFESKDHPGQLFAYQDSEGKSSLVYEVESHYGGIRTTLIETSLDTFSSAPIASKYSYYDLESEPQHYFVFPEDEPIGCSLSFLYGSYAGEDHLYEVTEGEYDNRIAAYMGGLTWTHDISYEPSIGYHYYNGFDTTGEVRYEEIRQAMVAGQEIDFQSDEEMKKTSDMVANALYEAYVGLGHPLVCGTGRCCGYSQNGFGLKATTE